MKQQTDNSSYLESPFMEIAIEEAKNAADSGEIPVGAVIVERSSGNIVAKASNRTKSDRRAIAHAEMIAIEKAMQKLNSEWLTGCDIYVSLEPCPMCAHAISLARIDRLYFAASDTKGGGVENGPRVFDSSSCNHKPEIYSGIKELESSSLLKQFFQSKRSN